MIEEYKNWKKKNGEIKIIDTKEIEKMLRQWHSASIVEKAKIIKRIREIVIGK